MKNHPAAQTDLFEHLLTHYRGILAVILLLPLSIAYDAYMALGNLIRGLFFKASGTHDEKVGEVIRQIEDWKRAGCREKLCTARSGWLTMSEMVPKYKLSHRKIRIAMDAILEIDEVRRTVRVEPLANMGRITRHLISRGWILPVVPELDDLTVGGLLMGFGVETSSHKYGLFQHICTAFEIVTAEGKLMRCSESENPELYYLLPWSHGTLGFLVAAELKIIPAKTYVRVHYQPIYTFDGWTEFFEKASLDTAANDFVEALVYDRCHAVVMCGTLTDELGPDAGINPIGNWYKPWFYKYVEFFLINRTAGVDYVPLRDYLHRHTRSYFWAMEEIIEFGNRPWFRALLGWALPPRIELLKYTETETTRRLREQYHTIQDMLMPIRYLQRSIDYFDEHFDLYPLWLCPMRVPGNDRKLGFIHPFYDGQGKLDEVYVDIGAYGTPKKSGFYGPSALATLEHFVIENHGYQALYAKTLLSREGFRTMFDHTGYDRLRERLPYCKQAFDEVYDKVSAKGRTSPVEIRKLAGSGQQVAF